VAVEEEDKSPPEASVLPRAKSCSDFYSITRARAAKPSARKQQKSKKTSRSWEALLVPDSVSSRVPHDNAPRVKGECDSAILKSSQQEWLLYQEQLALAERHLASLVSDTDSALRILSTLASSFRAVDTQTSSFRARCEGLITEQRRLERLADDVGTDLHYYAYLEGATRRLNGPGAGRLVDDLEFSEMLRNLDACVEFMNKHPEYRDAESYLARYQALLTKALRLLEIGFSARLDKVSSELAKQIAGAKSEATQHALAYGRFQDSMLDSYSLIPNVKKTCRRVYDASGARLPAATLQSPEPYANTVGNMFQTYLGVRDRDLRPVLQREVEFFKTQAKGANVETATRNYLKQGFERAASESDLFIRIFGVEPLWSQDPESAYAATKTPNLALIHPGSVVPLATHVQAVLQGAELQNICSIVGSLSNEYLSSEYEDEDETPLVRQCRQFAVRLLAEHLWNFTDAAFEAEITKTITKGAASPEALKMVPVTNGVASSNAYPLVKKALELLTMFDQAMPKERTQKNSPVVFKIVRETIQVLQRAEQKIKSSRGIETDADLFMVKNLLILKNELVSLEIGDIRTAQESSLSAPSMAHFSEIWDATLTPTKWIPGIFSIGGGIGSMIGSGASALWSSRGSASGASSGITAKTLTVEDMSEQIDELLRQHIYAFTRRWGERVGEIRERKGSTASGAGSGPVLSGGRSVAKAERELEGLLATTFGSNSEVVARLKEAIDMHAQTAGEPNPEKGAVRRY
jgi:hypothetical protein